MPGDPCILGGPKTGCWCTISGIRTTQECNPVNQFLKIRGVSPAAPSRSHAEHQSQKAMVKTMALGSVTICAHPFGRQREEVKDIWRIVCVCCLKWLGANQMCGESGVWRIKNLKTPYNLIEHYWTRVNQYLEKNTRFDGAQGICHVLLKRSCLVAQVCRGCIWLGVNLRKPIQWWITKIAGRWVSQIKVTMMTKVWARIRDTVNHDGEKTEHPCTWFLLCF